MTKPTSDSDFHQSAQVLTPEALAFLDKLEHESGARRCALLEARHDRQKEIDVVKHQAFVGAGYFDQVQVTVTSGEVSTTSLKGSTEEVQFHSP